MVRWNLSSKLRRYEGADVIVMSVGKSGRTWLRVLLNKYLSLHFNAPFHVGDLHMHNSAIPSILYDHEMWSHYCDASWLERLLGTNIVPQGLLMQKKVVLMYRDPRDVVVSLHFQKRKRSPRRMNVDVSTFIRDPYYGVANVVRVMSLWRRRLTDHPHCLWMSYEGMKADARQELHRLLAFLGIQARDELVEEAVSFAAFDNMKKLEANDAFGVDILRPGDVSDPDSYKVREGRVGGYARHFGETDLSFLDQAVARLHPFYPYAPGARPGPSG